MTQINLLFDSRPKKVFSAIEGKSTLENWKENQIFQVSVVITFSLQKMIQNMYKNNPKMAQSRNLCKRARLQSVVWQFGLMLP